MVAVIAFAFGWMASIFGYVFALMERERAVLSAMVVEDELTGLASRRFFWSVSRKNAPGPTELACPSVC